MACMGEVINTYKIVVRKSEGKRSLQRSSHRQYNIELELKKVGGLDLTDYDWA